MKIAARALLAGAFWLVPHAFGQGLPAFQAAGDIRFACGGIGADERRAMETLRGQARVEVLFVSAQRGAYLSDVRLTVRREGREAPPALDLVSNGPICLLDAPPGRYRLEARWGTVTRAQSFDMRAGGRLARVVLAFPDEPWDGIRASEEEKRQAREP